MYTVSWCAWCWDVLSSWLSYGMEWWLCRAALPLSFKPSRISSSDISPWVRNYANRRVDAVKKRLFAWKRNHHTIEEERKEEKTLQNTYRNVMQCTKISIAQAKREKKKNKTNAITQKILSIAENSHIQYLVRTQPRLYEVLHTRGRACTTNTAHHSLCGVPRPRAKSPHIHTDIYMYSHVYTFCNIHLGIKQEQGKWRNTRHLTPSLNLFFILLHWYPPNPSTCIDSFIHHFVDRVYAATCLPGELKQEKGDIHWVFVVIVVVFVVV